jgi:hypothetical protein
MKNKEDFFMAEGGQNDAMRAILQRLSIEDNADGGGSSGSSGGGGATHTASSGNIFNVESEITGIGYGESGNGILKLFDFNALTASDIKTFFEGNDGGVIAILFGKINAGNLMFSIDFLANVRNLQPHKFLDTKPVTIFGGVGH